MLRLKSLVNLKTWFLYVVECKDGTLYTGITTDVQRRVEEHNSKSCGAKYTKSRRPVKLVYQKEYPDRSSVSKAEWAFKKLSRKNKLEALKSS